MFSAESLENDRKLKLTPLNSRASFEHAMEIVDFVMEVKGRKIESIEITFKE